jgi:peptidoglycan/LPS O-acetylase OafA/YrhL
MTGVPDTPERAGRERLAALDLLRFLAAGMVVLFHYTFRGAADGTYLNVTFPELDPFTRYGSFGVNLFFVISGFVILLTVDAGGGRPAHFVASRISRLFPAFWAATTLTFVICVVAGASFAVGPIDYILNLGMLPSWFGASYVDAAYWTLELELHFYLLIVGYLLFLQRRLAVEWLLLGWLIVILPFAPNELGPTRLRLLLMTDAAPFFVAGCIFYRVWRDGWTRFRVGLLVASWLIACVVAAKGALAASVTYATDVSPWVAAAVASVGFVVFTAFCLWPALLRIGGWRATLLGALTYPLYLVHEYIGYVVINIVGATSDRWLAVGAALAVVLGLAFAINRLVERPYNGRFRRWLEPRLAGLDRAGQGVVHGIAMRLGPHHRP